MQEDALVKAQQLASKHSHSKKQFDGSKDAHSSSRHKPVRVRTKKKSHSNASSLLSFKVDHKEHLPSKLYRPAPQTITDLTLSPYFRFALIAGDYRSHHLDSNLVFDWDTVRKVRVLADSEVRCPICLENQLVAGRVAKCGHYFCWPCVIRYMWTCQGNKKCPVCNATMKAVDLRTVCVRTYKHVAEGENANFGLMRRAKGSITVAWAGDEEMSAVIKSSSELSWANRLSIYDERDSDYNSDKLALLSVINTEDSLERNSVQRALDLLEKQNSDKDPKMFSSFPQPDSNLFYFYQISDTQPYFLHPLNMAMMKRQFNDFKNFPLNISGKVLEIDRIQVTEAEQKKFGY
jgi:hypothetical protein